jgi:hypothetical protein
VFEVPHSAPLANDRRLALLWMGTATINLFGVSLLYMGVLRALPFLGVSFDMIVMLNNLLLVALQWLVLRRFFPQMRWWVPAHGAVLGLQLLLDRILSALAKVFLLILLFRTESAGLMENFDFASSAIVSLFWALISGVVGWRIFRPQVRRAGRWLAAVVVGASLQLLISFLIIWPLIRSRTANLTAYTLINIAVTLAVAAIQAAVLVMFLRERERSAAPALV